MSAHGVPSLKDQAFLLDAMVRRTKLRDGSQAATTIMSLNAFEVEQLQLIARRLERMAPHEVAIRKLVVGR